MDKIRVVVTIGILLMLAIVPAYAAEGNNVTEEAEAAGAGMIVKACNLILISLADALNSIWQDSALIAGGMNSSDVTEEFGIQRTSVMYLVSVNLNPEEITAIQQFDDKSIKVWALIVCLFIFGIPILEVYTRSHPGTYERVFGVKHFTDEEFVGISILCMASYLAPDYVILFLKLCTAISQWLMINVMDFIEPSLDNAWMYLFMAIGDLLLAAFYLVRPWVLCIVYAFARFLAIFYFMGFMKDEVTWAWSKFHKIALMQPLTVGVTCLSLVAIKWVGLEDIAAVFIILYVFVAYIDYKFLTGGWGLHTLKRLALRSALKR